MTVNISKVKVSETMKGQWAVTLNMKLMEGTEELFNQDFSEDYNTGNNISDIGQRFKNKMQSVISKYKSEQAIFTHIQLDTVVSGLQSQLEV